MTIRTASHCLGCCLYCSMHCCQGSFVQHSLACIAKKMSFFCHFLCHVVHIVHLDILPWAFFWRLLACNGDVVFINLSIRVNPIHSRNVVVENWWIPKETQRWVQCKFQNNVPRKFLDYIHNGVNVYSVTRYSRVLQVLTIVVDWWESVIIRSPRHMYCKCWSQTTNGVLHI